VAIAVLAVLGTGVEDRLTPTSLGVPGTPSARGGQLLREHFGESAPFALLLRGPSGALERQGPALIRALRSDPTVTTLSPWDGKQLDRLRPAPGKALVLVDFHVSTAVAVDQVVPELEATVRRKIEAPVRATQTGYASLSRAIQNESIDSTEKAELIAIPFLLLVLLLVFRTPVAAIVPLAFGAIAVIVSRGVLFLVSAHIAIDAFALTVATMMGLALGVDYALLMVSRFREELELGKDPVAAALSTRRTAGRTTLFAGFTLFVSMIVSVFVLPGSLLLSLAGTAILVTAVSLVTSIYLAPALLSLLGHNVNRWALRSSGGERHNTLQALLRAALRRPAPVAIGISLALLLLAVPAIAIKTGPPSAKQLPASSPARLDAERVSRQIGPGWDAPFVLVAASPRGPITTAADLRHLARFQNLLARQPGVQAVIGPKEIAERAAPMRSRGSELLGDPGRRRVAQMQGFGSKLERAAGGVGQLRAGISEAAAGAGLLGEGSGRAQAGATRIASGLQRAAVGGAKATAAIGRLASGTAKLADVQHAAQAGSLSLALGLRVLLPHLRKNSLKRAQDLRRMLDAGARQDSSLQQAADKAAILVRSLAAARSELRSLRNDAARLNGGMVRLVGGAERISEGTRRLSDGASALGSGLQRLAGGSAALAAGLGRLRGGTEALASGLSGGYTRSARLQSGLGRAGVRVSAQASDLWRQRARLKAASPHLFESGYFVLSALDGAKPSARAQAAQAIDLGKGGQAASILVVPRYTFNTEGSEAVYRRLDHLADRFAHKTGLRVGLAGGAAELTDYNQVTRARVPLVIVAMTLVTFLALVFLLRAVILAALAVVLNLMTVGVAFGVLVLLFDVPAGWPLGGHDYVDAIGAAGIFGIVFGLSVDYAVFLLARMRETYDETGDHEAAISFGLEKTARVITGAAAIMMAVFVVFAAAPISTVSQLGVGLAVAVALDATVVRIVLLPALMLLIGERVWWLPRPLARALPKIDLHPA
jgi:RND superfamily putative drug exporter